jgi:hypothetical protein
MAGFVQIIQIQTSRIDEVERLGKEIQQRLDDGNPSAPRRAIFTEDRDRPGHYVNIVEFASYEAAMENSNRPEVSEFARRLAELCDAPPEFSNLDVREAWTPSVS